jgi:hypothetical protein
MPAAVRNLQRFKQKLVYLRIADPEQQCSRASNQEASLVTNPGARLITMPERHCRFRLAQQVLNSSALGKAQC